MRRRSQGRPARVQLAARAGAGVLLTLLLVLAAASAARLAGVHTLAQEVQEVQEAQKAQEPHTARDGRLYPAPPGTSAAVGALFTTSTNAGTTKVADRRRHRAIRLGSHFCTGSVVGSPAGNLVLTAAHCLAGRSPSQVVFVPGYRDGTAPYGVWPVTRVIVDEAWSASARPEDDLAFLVVHQPGTRASVQSFTGGERLGLGQPPRQLSRSPATRTTPGCLFPAATGPPRSARPSWSSTATASPPAPAAARCWRASARSPDWARSSVSATAGYGHPWVDSDRVVGT